MEAFVDAMLRLIGEATTDADIELLLGHLAEHLGYRSAYLLDFPSDETLPIRLWDSNAARRDWWHDHTANGTHSISRSLAKMLSVDGVQHLEITPEDPRYAFAHKYDFFSATLVPVTFDHETRGVASFSGDAVDLSLTSDSLQIVCYALLTQAHLIGSEIVARNASLTPREREIMALSAEGMTSETVAAQLGISPRTVNQHIDNIAAKLRTRNRVHTVAEAIRRGFLA